ncbi:helix-turn-helix domain-containing protein [Fuchsiella alkaliacetigena]|uniref:helix-turn-helix domain-containing protein n=1 Tax=Fuchsiella alkaliacetigena TaxID=957042 RepID=UPI00200B9261|nr:helix-turn-helix domain-containing protein [Fuchsiella alkaliacetigena]MCK8823992.1 helix-turn-helix domain-containing protein [Fuchsiella alkaliacetigena]
MKEDISNSSFENLIEKSRQEFPFSLKVKDLKRLLPHGETKIYEMLEREVIPAKKIGGRWVVSRDRFLAWYYGSGE